MAEPPETCIVETPNDGGATHIFVIGTDIEKYGEAGFADGQGAAARFKYPYGVVLLPDSGEFVVSCDHALRVVTPGGAVRRLAGSGQPGFADGQGAAARPPAQVRLSWTANRALH